MLARHHNRGRRAATWRQRKSVAGQQIETLESRLLMAADRQPIWTIRGDLPGQPLDDTIVVNVSPTNPERIQVTINGRVIASRQRDHIGGLRVLAGRGNDQVTVDLGQENSDIPGLISPPGPRISPPAFTADRPFAFAIRDVQSGAIMLAGRVMSPTTAASA